MTKAAQTMVGAVVGLFSGGFVGYWVGFLLYHNDCGVVRGIRIIMSSFFGIPIGAIVCGVIAYQLARLSEQAAKQRDDDNPEAKVSTAGSDEKGGASAERGGMAKVRVELTSYVYYDSIRDDLERAGFQRIDKRTRLERFLCSDFVKQLTGTINAARIQELAALSFVESVARWGESRHTPSTQ